MRDKLPTKPFSLVGKALVIALPLVVLIIGGAIAAAYTAPWIALTFARAAPETGAFPPMTLVFFNLTTIIHPVACLIGFGVVFLATVGVLALPRKQQRLAAMAAGILIVAFWVAVGLRVHSAFFGPNYELTNDTDALE